MSSVEVDWESREPTFAYARAEVVRLVKRARRRLALVILIGIVAGGGYATKKLLQKKQYEAQLTLRVVESDFDLTAAVRPHSEYLNYVWHVFLSAPRLIKLIEQYQLYPSKYAIDPQQAVEALRSDLEVVVWRNYFLWERYGDDTEARSARISVAWNDKDPQRVLDVVQSIGKIIIDAQTEERVQVFELARNDLREANELAAERLGKLKRSIAQKRLELAKALPARRTKLEVELRSMVADEKNFGKRADEMGSTRNHLEITAAWEKERSGLRFELVDPGFVLPQEGGGRPTIAFLSAAIFVGAGFLAALLLGALEVRINRLDDVRRLGIGVLGALPKFEGDNVGTLNERVRAADRLKWGGS